MSTHVEHPLLIEHGLADDCPRCAEIAADPLAHLDDGNLASLVTRTRRWMSDGTLYPRSEAEAHAMRWVEMALRWNALLERLDRDDDELDVEIYGAGVK